MFGRKIQIDFVKAPKVTKTEVPEASLPTPEEISHIAKDLMKTAVIQTGIVVAAAIALITLSQIAVNAANANLNKD